MFQMNDNCLNLQSSRLRRGLQRLSRAMVTGSNYRTSRLTAGTPHDPNRPHASEIHWHPDESVIRGSTCDVSSSFSRSQRLNQDLPQHHPVPPWLSPVRAADSYEPLAPGYQQFMGSNPIGGFIQQITRGFSVLFLGILGMSE